MAISDELRKLVDPNNECCCEHCLGNKCKERILAEGYSFFSYSDDNSEWYAQCKLVMTDIQPLTWSVADTEPDVVFEAAEWVRQQKEN